MLPIRGVKSINLAGLKRLFFFLSILYHDLVCSSLKGSELYLQISPCSAPHSCDQSDALFQDRNSGREAVNQLDVHLPVRVCEGELFIPLWCRGAKRGETGTALLCASLIAEIVPGSPCILQGEE